LGNWSLTVRKRSAFTRAATDAVSTTADATVFLDPSGRRWRTMLGLGLPIILVFLAAATYGGFRITEAPVASPDRTAVAIDDIAPAPGEPHLDVIGEGPMLRVLKIDRDGEVVGRDPFTGEVVMLTADEINAAGNDEYVIQRYGYAAGATRTISLTFDDGPHPISTPELLDVLSAERVPATFFVTGNVAVQHPELIQRMAREGHAVGNHTLTHADLNDVSAFRAREELFQTDRILRSLTSQGTSAFRLPYGGTTTEEVKDNILGILRAQQLGYHPSGYDFETLDWSYGAGHASADAADIPLPEFDGRNITILMHDGGADNRAATVEYVKTRLIPAARAAAYTFQTMPQIQPDLRDSTHSITPSIWDRATATLAQLIYVWPNRVMRFLFVFALTIVGVIGVSHTAMAIVRRRRQPRYDANVALLPVSILIAAYNEEKVIRRTLETLLGSTYPFLELLVVNDGSTDRTAAEVEAMMLRDPRIRLISQPNRGKWAALNNGTAQARGDILVTLDADTIFTPETVANLVRQFAVDPDGRLGAVAGVVRVGNRERNLLTRWQGLEYLTQIGVERSAYAQLGAVPIIPGACAAWRKAAITEVGGYSNATLAEDCDLTLSLHQARWRVSQDDEALAYTEAPDHADALLAQRIRWTFGTLQAIFKHRDMLLRSRYGWLGMAVLPYMVISVVVPIVFLPFIAVMGVLAVQNSGWAIVGLYFLLFLALHLLIAAVAVILMRERWANLLMVPIYRVVHEPLRAYLLYTSAYLAIRGVKLGWNKLQRTGVMDPVLDQHGQDHADSIPRQRQPEGAHAPAARALEEASTK
jgi:cellulose synthase/poly-beta-1,6-N-acetylglucosamine synthase-like glycosyltransferase/peptidoglycan/xylan/chitin deacetylase (PgdA/CDA1 family)